MGLLYILSDLLPAGPNTMEALASAALRTFVEGYAALLPGALTGAPGGSPAWEAGFNGNQKKLQREVGGTPDHPPLSKRPTDRPTPSSLAPRPSFSVEVVLRQRYRRGGARPSKD